MRPTVLWVGLALAGILLLLGCGGASDQGSVKILKAEEAKSLLLQLPYHYRFRAVRLPQGASGALAGVATGQHHTVLNFGVALGRKPDPVPVPRAGIKGALGYGGYVFSDDLEVPGNRRKWEPGPQFHTEAQWNEAINMEVRMEEGLCKAETGEPCKEG